MSHAVLKLSAVSVARDGYRLLDRVDWTVQGDQRWIVLGPNGSGKTTLCRIASMYLHPTTGDVEVLGGRLGKMDVRATRARLGVTSPVLAEMLRPTLAVADVVATGKHAALAPWWHQYTEADDQRARALLERFGCGHLAGRLVGTLSSGERQRVLLARTLMADPALLLLDEPTAGLDLGGREQLVSMLQRLATDPAAPPTIFVTHHVDEIPPGFTHLLLLARGRVVAAGPLDETLTADALSRCFDVRLQLERRDGRWTARAANDSP